LRHRLWLLLYTQGENDISGNELGQADKCHQQADAVHTLFARHNPAHEQGTHNPTDTANRANHTDARAQRFVAQQQGGKGPEDAARRQHTALGDNQAPNTHVPVDNYQDTSRQQGKAREKMRNARVSLTLFAAIRMPGIYVESNHSRKRGQDRDQTYCAGALVRHTRNDHWQPEVHAPGSQRS
jgi:hypothetical protein